MDKKVDIETVRAYIRGLMAAWNEGSRPEAIRQLQRDRAREILRQLDIRETSDADSQEG